MTQVFVGEVLKVDANGELSVVTLRVTDTDTQFNSQAAGSEWVVEGTSLGPNTPELRLVNPDPTYLNGITDLYSDYLRFEANGNIYYVPPSNVDANQIAGLDTTLMGGNYPAQSFNYINFGLVSEDAEAYSVTTLNQFRDTSGAVVSLIPTALYLFDDDGEIEFASETGVSPQATNSYEQVLAPYSTDQGSGDTNMVLVQIEYLTATGPGSMNAIRLADQGSSNGSAVYIPGTPLFALQPITEITSETVFNLSIEGVLWADFYMSTLPFYRAMIGTMMMGQMSDDIIDGNDVAETIMGYLGDDTITGNDGYDLLTGGVGNDDLDGGLGGDTLRGGPGDDTLNGHKGADSITGGDGDETITGDKGNDTIRGEAGFDTIDGGDGDDFITGGLNKDSLTGGAGNDSLSGGYGRDTLDGGTEDDLIVGGYGHDNLIGADGNDTLKGEEGNDTLEAGKGDDQLRGDSGNDSLSGGKGFDTLLGNQGDDTLDGGLNEDILTGGFGADVFAFGDDGVTDTITDFENGVDVIDLDVDFSTLTFADIAPGEVHITHEGEILIVQDTAGTLTSADFDSTDFI